MSDSPSRSTQPSSEPVRLKVSYKSASSLLSEFTKSVGKGGVALESVKKLPPGTRFIFELHASDAKDPQAPVEVIGEVVSVTPQEKGKYLLNIRYDAGGDRKALDGVLRRIFDAQRFEKARKHPRVPIKLRATEDAPYSPSYLIRDVSTGGVGMEVEAPTLPGAISLGAPFLLEIWLSLGMLALHGEVVWIVSAPPGDQPKWTNPCFGVSFGRLRTETAEHLKKILLLRGLPPPPWKARISFGMDAVARMP